MVTSSKTSVTEIAITEEISILTSICHGKDSGCCGRKVDGGLRIACCSDRACKSVHLALYSFGAKYTRKIGVVQEPNGLYSNLVIVHVTGIPVDASCCEVVGTSITRLHNH